MKKTYNIGDIIRNKKEKSSYLIYDYCPSKFYNRKVYDDIYELKHSFGREQKYYYLIDLKNGERVREDEYSMQREYSPIKFKRKEIGD